MEPRSKKVRSRWYQKIDGILKIRRDALVAVNSLGEMMIASRHGDFPIKKVIRLQEPGSFRL